MIKKKLIIITNEKIFQEGEKSFCNNIDIKTTSENLNKNFEVLLFGRKSLKKTNHKIDINSIIVCSGLIGLFKNIKQLISERETKFLIISLTPFTFFVNLFLKVFGKKTFLYLRSDGFIEYKKILGLTGSIVYRFMFLITSKISKLISVNNFLLRGNKGFTVIPSQLNDEWMENRSVPNLDKNDLLYVGRLRVEKGIFSLINIIKDKNEVRLTIVGNDNKLKGFSENNIKIFDIETNQTKLIKHYDENNIFILPSFTEGSPMVMIEALARLRPVIIFEEIKHIVGTYKGVFVSKREYSSLIKQIEFIKENYRFIQKEIETNVLPKNDNFIKSIQKIIDNE